MFGRNRLKTMLAVLAALMLLAVFMLPVLAASANVEEVVGQLEALQRANIDPAWPPDVRANEQPVQALLNAYLLCSKAERKEFTSQQNKDLRAYFEALYALQGKDPERVDDIFAGKVAAPVQSAPLPSSAQSASVSSAASSGAVSSSAAAVSSSSASFPASSPAGSVAASGSSGLVAAAGSASVAANASSSAVVLAPVSQATAPDVSRTVFLPQVPRDTGFLGNAGMSSLLLIAIGALLFILFVRYLAALHAVGRSKRLDKNALMVKRELYGENYNPETDPDLTEEDFTSAAQRKTQAKAEKDALRKERQEEKELRRRLKQARGQNADENTGAAIGDDPFAGSSKADFADPLPTKERRKESPGELPKAGTAKMGGKAPVSPSPSVTLTGFSASAQTPAPGEAAKPKTTRAQGGKSQFNTRTERPKGRPQKKLPFNQGDAHDLDAIDD